MFTINGSIKAPNCGGGYAIENANVTVRNENDTIIGSAQTGTHDPFSADTNYGCETHFTVTVPRAQFYHVKVGTHDGPATPFDELQAHGWQLQLSLGQAQ